MVTAHDIESSLYYFHVASRKDQQLLELAQSSENGNEPYSRAIGDSAATNPSGIQRKPLLPKRRSTLERGPKPPRHAHTRSQPLDMDLSSAIDRNLLDVNRGQLSQDSEAYLPHIAGPPPRHSSSTMIGTSSTRRKPIGSNSQEALEGISEGTNSPRSESILGELKEILIDKHDRIGGVDHRSSKLTDAAPPLPARKLLGTRPPNIRPHTASFSQNVMQENIKPRRWSGQLPPPGHALIMPPSLGSTIDSHSQPNATRDNAAIKRYSRSEDQLDHLITVIRRDPSSGVQWNTGQLNIGPPSELGLNISAHMQPPHSPRVDEEVQIDITTPGYFKFIASENDAKLNSNPVFHRQLLMKNPKAFAVSQVSHHSNVRSSLESRRSSEWSVNSSESASQTTITSSESNRPIPRAYSFLSPWNGVCEFTTGIAGRSLKCRHMLPSTSSPSATVSELRFNLPSSSIFGKAAAKYPVLSKQTRSSRDFVLSSSYSDRSSYDGEPTQPSHFDLPDLEHIDSDLDEPMDLSLGQERAGGGLRGRQAKLGKLIIEDEGLKMLDLLVAANIAVWWGVYGRSGSRQR